MAIRLRQSGMTWHVLGDEVVVLDLNGSTYFKTNGSGAFLWAELVESRSEGDLVKALVDRYGIDELRATADVANFLTALREHRLVEE